MVWFHFAKDALQSGQAFDISAFFQERRSLSRSHMWERTAFRREKSITHEMEINVSNSPKLTKYGVPFPARDQMVTLK